MLYRRVDRLKPGATVKFDNDYGNEYWRIDNCSDSDENPKKKIEMHNSALRQLVLHLYPDDMIEIK